MGLLTRFVLALQPKVTTIEQLPSRRSSGIIALPRGTRWCRGKPTIWIPGHKDRLEDGPDCLNGGNWTRPHIAYMDTNDVLNRIDSNNIDRHECGVLDINDDGIRDIYCLVGANKGRGLGFNEIYLTRKDGSLRKVKRHGLQRFRGTRTRRTVVLKGSNHTRFVFISATQGPRKDGRRNKHAMFVKTGKGHVDPYRRYFELVPGPWNTKPSGATCALSVDVNNDGLDDLIVCNEKVEAFLFIQKKTNLDLEQ